MDSQQIHNLIEESFLPLISNNVLYGVDAISCHHKDITFDLPLFQYEGTYQYRGSNYSSENIIKAHIKHVICSESCQALILKEYYSDRIIDVIYEYSLMGTNHLVLWRPKFEEIFMELIGDTTYSDATNIHYNIMQKYVILLIPHKLLT